MAHAVTDQSFDAEVAQAKGYVLVDFWAEWCGPCRQLAPVVDEISRELSGKLKVCKVDIEANPDTPTRFGVRGIPTLILFKDGKNIATKIGALAKSSLLEWLGEHISA